jgi:hypothetical protein
MDAATRFAKKMSGLPRAVGVGQHPGDREPEAPVELAGMVASNRLQVANRARYIRVQVDPADVRLAVLIVAAQPERHGTASGREMLQILDERAPDTLPAV